MNATPPSAYMPSEESGAQGSRGAADVPDHAGASYRTVLERLHEVLKPRNYLEIGTENGGTLAIARCASIAVDPSFNFSHIDVVKRIISKPALHLFSTTSDDFFRTQDPQEIFGAELDMVFLDGMHRCEYLLRDFINVERLCAPNSVILVHDCFPVEPAIACRTQGAQEAEAPHRSGWWTGDVWRTALLLKRHRPDLKITSLDAAPTGLLAITGLDPSDASLSEDYFALVQEMLGWELAEIGIANFFAEMELESANFVHDDDQVTARFWL